MKIDRRLKYKRHERGCYVCKRVLPLTENFYPRHNSIKRNRGFRWECIDCCKKVSRDREQRLNRDFRIDFVAKNGNKCASCNLYSDNPSFFDIDHIVPILKRIREPRYREKTKRQILCPNCHRLKTISEREKGLYKRKK